MPPLMDLIAGDRREILLVVAVEDWPSFDDPSRFPAHLSLAGLDPTWLDLFSEAVRRVTGGTDPVDFLDAREELPAGQASERLVERVDGDWVAAVADVRSERLDAVAARWIDLIADEIGPVDADDRPWIRQLTADLVTFARRSAGAPEVLFAWSL